MPTPIDLSAIIEDSLTDAVSEPEVDASLESSSEQTGEEVTPIDSTGSDDKTVIDSPSKAEGTDAPLEKEVASPAAKVQSSTDVDDDFAKAHGLPPQMVGGRENRIPYSRVKKIAANHAKTEVEKAKKEWETTQSPISAKYAELEPKVKDYEDRLGRVAQFEQVMVNQPREFLENVLSKIPAYKEFFDFVNQAAAVMQAQAAGTATPQTAQQTTQTTEETMPQPDFKLEDGTMVYSMDGLQKLQDWHEKRIEARLSKTYDQRLNDRLSEVEKQYGPIKQQYEVQQKLAEVAPQVQKQIEEAHKWALFTENEDAITAALVANPNLSLEGAYRQVVIPKMQTNRDQMRTSILEEIQKKPTTTAVSRSAAVKPVQQSPSGQPQNLIEIIEAKVREAGLS